MDNCEIRLTGLICGENGLKAEKLGVCLAYPAEAMQENVEYTFDWTSMCLRVCFKKEVMARLFEITF